MRGNLRRLITTGKAQPDAFKESTAGKDYTASFSVDQPPKEVFDAINNVRGWWSEEIEGSTNKQGAEFNYHYKDVHGCSEDNTYRRYDYRPPKNHPAKKVVDPRLIAMREKVTSDEGKRIYGRRASSVEPAFGIIKSAMGLRQFLLRGMAKVRIEWVLVCRAYNMRRLWSLSSA